MGYSQTQFLDNIDEVEEIEDASTLNQVMELLEYVSTYDTLKMEIKDIKAIPIEVLEYTWNITSQCTDYYGNRNPGELIATMCDTEGLKDNLISIKSKFVADDDDFF